MSIPKLFAVLAAVALLFAPAMTGAAYAAAAQHDMAMAASMPMMEGAPCKSAPAGDHHKGMAESCCMSMCMAVAIAPPAPEELPVIKQPGATFALPKSHQGFLGEIATPPPRRS